MSKWIVLKESICSILLFIIKYVIWQRYILYNIYLYLYIWYVQYLEICLMCLKYMITSLNSFPYSVYDFAHVEVPSVLLATWPNLPSQGRQSPRVSHRSPRGTRRWTMVEKHGKQVESPCFFCFLKGFVSANGKLVVWIPGIPYD